MKLTLKELQLKFIKELFGGIARPISPAAEYVAGIDLTKEIEWR